MPRLPRLGGRAGRAFRLLEHEWVAVTSLGFFAIVALVAIPQQLVQDSWLALVAGREIVGNGLPATDSLNVWTRGAEWVDQQWLAQSVLYGLFSAGGLRLTMLAHVAWLTATLVLGVVAARRLGGSVTSASLLAIVCVLSAPWALQVRPQAAAMPLFVLLLWLLAADSRDSSRRVYLVLPLLVLWANVHGAVVLGAALVVLRGFTIAYGRSRPAAAAILTTAPFACLFASPYGLSLVGYYDNVLFNPLLREYVVEWQASAPSATTAAFYAYTVAAVWLIARYRGLLTVFERAALVLTLVAGLLAVRSILWFALAALILLPSLLDRTLRRLPTLPHASPFKRGVAGAAIVCVAATATVVATREESWFQQEWPAAAAQRAAAAARAPHVDVISDERYADWLLWEHPELAGRVAFGIRFELFSAGQFETLAAYKRATDAGWDRAAREYGVLVLDRRARTADAEAVLTRRGYNVAYRDRDVAVLVERNATQ